MIINAKTMKKIFIACLMAGALTSCLDDEGNYTYTELNEIKIEGLEDTYKVLNKIDHIVIEPQVTGTILGDDDSQYEYEWHICADGLYHSNHKVISHEKNLDYLADFDLSKQDANYNLYLTVTDKTTGLKAQASASIKPSTSYSKGFIVLGDDESTGDIGLDMIVMPPGRDTTLVSNVIDNSETHWKGADRLLYSGMHYRKQQLWMCCDDGSYSMDLQSLAPVAELNDMALIDTEFKHNMPMKVKDFFPHQGLGGNARNANYTGYMTEDMVVYALTIPSTYFTTPCNRTSSTSEKLFKFYPMVFSMGAYSSAYNTFMMLYNTDEQRFMRITMSGIAASYCSTLADLPTDIFYWNQANYDKPRKIVWGGNSVNGSYGSSYALMKNDDGEFFLYKFQAGSSSAVKQGCYDIDLSVAEHLADASHYAVSGTNSILIYSYGSTLYLYDYAAKTLFKRDMGAEITYLDLEAASTGSRTAFMIATYSSSEKGTIRKLDVGTDPNVLEVKDREREVWKTNLRVKDIEWKRNYGS